MKFSKKIKFDRTDEEFLYLEVDKWLSKKVICNCYEYDLSVERCDQWNKELQIYISFSHLDHPETDLTPALDKDFWVDFIISCSNDFSKKMIKSLFEDAKDKIAQQILTRDDFNKCSCLEKHWK